MNTTTRIYYPCCKEIRHIGTGLDRRCPIHGEAGYSPETAWPSVHGNLEILNDAGLLIGLGERRIIPGLEQKAIAAQQESPQAFAERS